LTRLIRTSLNQAAPHGLSEVEVASGGLQGTRLLLDLQQEKDLWLGNYEPDLQKAIAELALPGMIAYDVGANIGYLSLLLSLFVGTQGKVVAFEALPENIERLHANLALNKTGAHVQVVPAAVVERTRAVRFLIGPSDDTGKAEGSAGRQKVTYQESIQVEGLSLDDFVYGQGGPAPDLIKMDIEGGEVLALPGMRRILSKKHPILLLELHGPQSAAAAWSACRTAGYRICQASAGYPEVQTVDELDWKAYLVGLPERESLEGPA
jgi:FkbM family methyltransferase